MGGGAVQWVTWFGCSLTKSVGQYVKISRDAERIVDEQRQSENLRVVKGIKFGQ
jgi:hypothetical protein